ncbi:TolC family protein [Sporocytophaga myxococcoides]|nr:TolC family protein [Sporocytophaga myxococcoides]
MNKIKFFMLAVIWTASFLTAFSQDTLTLEKAIEIGLENNYTIIIARNTQKIAENSNTLGNAGFLPTVDLNFNNTGNLVNTHVEYQPPTPPRDANGLRPKSIAANALVNWTIFDGFNMFITKNKLQELEKAGQTKARTDIEVTVANIINTYYSIVQQQKMMYVIQEAIGLSLQRLKLAQSMKSIGTGSEQAIYQAMVDANADSTRLLQQAALIRNAKADMNRLLAREITTSFEVRPEIPINSKLEYNDLIQKLESQNAMLLTSRANANIARYDIESYRSQYLPTIGVFGGYNYTKTQNPVSPARLNRSNGLTYGVTASMNIFTGGVTNLNVQNAKILYQSSSSQYEDTKLSLKNDLYKYYNNYLTSIQLVNIQVGNVEVARKDLNIAVGRYKLGNINDIDLRITQQKLTDAENNLLSAQFTAKTAEIELQRLSGQLLNDLQ